MSLSEAAQGFPGQPHRPPSYPYSNGEPSRSSLPTLPPMASLLNPMEEDEPRSPYAAHHPQQPYNMVKQHPPQHPPHQAQFDPSTYLNRVYFSPDIVDLHYSQNEHQSLLAAQPSRMFPPAPLVQRRQIKKITQRRADHPKDHGQSIRQPANFPYEKRDTFKPHIKPEISSPSGPPSPTLSRTPPPHMSSQSQGMRSVPISSLLSDDPRPSYQPPPQPTYWIRMRQEPIAARACGFGERDRRVIDPPPILQMSVSALNGTPDGITSLLRQPYAVVHCTLWDPEHDRDATAMPGTTDKRQQRRLMGTLVASPFFGKDEFDVDGCFFTFPDLSVRTPGTYSLRFSLVILNPAAMSRGTSEPVRSNVKSEPFQVYNAKDFAGMRPSTDLTKTLKHQGCLISVKKGNTKYTGAHAEEEEE